MNAADAHTEAALDAAAGAEARIEALATLEIIADAKDELRQKIVAVLQSIHRCDKYLIDRDIGGKVQTVPEAIGLHADVILDNWLDVFDDAHCAELKKLAERDD